MPERDELEALRAADPLDPASLPSAHSREAHDLFERITMTTPTSSTLPRGRIFAAAAAALAVAAVGAFALTNNDDSNPGRSATRHTSTSPAPIISSGSCVETYSLETLSHRATAFDGTVAAVEGDKVTFNVKQWFKGGSGTRVTLGGAEVLGGMTSAGPGANLSPGTRLLVAGDGGFAWACGFTQPYDAAVAQHWASVFAP